VKSQEVERETRRKVKLEKELQATKVDLEVKNSEVKQKQHQLQQAEEDHRKTEQQLKEARVRTCLCTCQLFMVHPIIYSYMQICKYL